MSVLPSHPFKALLGAGCWVEPCSGPWYGAGSEMGSCRVHSQPHRGCFMLSPVLAQLGRHRQHLTWLDLQQPFTPGSASLDLAPGAIASAWLQKGTQFPVKRAQVFLQSWCGGSAQGSRFPGKGFVPSSALECLESLCCLSVSLLGEVPALAVLCVPALSLSSAQGCP